MIFRLHSINLVQSLYRVMGINIKTNLVYLCKIHLCRRHFLARKLWKIERPQNEVLLRINRATVTDVSVENNFYMDFKRNSRVFLEKIT